MDCPTLAVTLKSCRSNFLYVNSDYKIKLTQNEWTKYHFQQNCLSINLTKSICRISNKLTILQHDAQRIREGRSEQCCMTFSRLKYIFQISNSRLSQPMHINGPFNAHNKFQRNLPINVWIQAKVKVLLTTKSHKYGLFKWILNGCIQVSMRFITLTQQYTKYNPNSL